MANAGARVYNGGLGADPPAEVQGADPQWGAREQSPPEVYRILVLEHTVFVLSCSL